MKEFKAPQMPFFKGEANWINVHIIPKWEESLNLYLSVTVPKYNSALYATPFH